MGINEILLIVNMVFTAIIGFYFYEQLKVQQSSKSVIRKESKSEIENIQRLRQISLTIPLSEKTRPKLFDEIIGQEKGIKALKASICCSNPQHVIIYGPPGIGKTAAARLVLEEAKKNSFSPFRKDAKFIEVDSATVRFDERGIADPLIGSVHDPIYQGAGAMGAAGIPQPKPGAVTKAHGGILFLDEIGELHPIQMNKLLKVLEDRKVLLESIYYSKEDNNIPLYIKDIFENGLPADFRLIGATTRSPEEIPSALRSRCVEIFFRGLNPEEIEIIADKAIRNAGYDITKDALNEICKYASNGREAVNLVQICCGIALNDNRSKIIIQDVQVVIESGSYSKRPERCIESHPQVGYVNGLAVYGANIGTIIEVEVTAIPLNNYNGKLTVTGIIEEEETENNNRKLKRKSSVSASINNVITVLEKYLDIKSKEYDIHINFPGGVPIDGPSAGIAIATAIYSAIKGIPVNNEVAMTGEISIRGYVKPVGGIRAKVEAACKAGVKKVIIPKGNEQEALNIQNIEIKDVERIEEVIKEALIQSIDENKGLNSVAEKNVELLSAKAENI